MKIKRLIVGEIATNCYFLISAGELAVIDPGGDADKILAEIKESGARLKYVINTHHHFDHILANEEVKGQAEILTHESSPNLKLKRPLKEGDKIKVGDINLTILHTPGHTQDSICLLSLDFIFTGDTLFENGYGRTDFPTSSEKKMKESLQKLSAILKPGMTVYPGHGEFYTVC